jgi:hypothetical protein
MNAWTGGPKHDGVGEEEQVRRLLSSSGARPTESPDELESVRAAARSAWQGRYGGRRRPAERRSWLSGPIVAAAAAAAIVAVAIGLWLARGAGVPSLAAAAATVEHLSGEASWRAAGDAGVTRAAAVGASIAGGSTLETATGTAAGANRVALRLAGGGSLRLDSGTRLRFVDAERIEIDRGAVYFDSAGARPGSAIELVTPAGRFRDVGTQFELRVSADTARSIPRARLRVREGSVRFEAGGGAPPVIADRGLELAVASNGAVERTPIATFGDSWSWVAASAPPLEIEGIRVRRFLDWLAREQGLRLEFANPEAESIAAVHVLHGSLAGLTLDEAPAAVLASCGLEHEIADGRLRIAVRTAS